MAEEVAPVELKPDTLSAFETYIREAETAMEGTPGSGPFLWSDGDSQRAAHLHNGKIEAEFWGGKGPIKVPHGLIHDWIGAVFVPRATVADTLASIQNYDNHKNIYRPEVIESKLISRDGDDFQIFLRVLKKKIITVVLDTYHAVHYFAVDEKRSGCRSYTTATCEVDDAGKPNEIVHPPDTGYGFLWRINSFWRFEDRADGVGIECRAISLTRDIPPILRWIIDPMVRSLPKEALIHTLKCTRDALTR